MKPDAFAAVMATGIVSTAWRRKSWDLTDLDVSLRLCTYVAACAVVQWIINQALVLTASRRCS